jgi:hypothetical protein
MLGPHLKPLGLLLRRDNKWFLRWNFKCCHWRKNLILLIESRYRWCVILRAQNVAILEHTRRLTGLRSKSLSPSLLLHRSANSYRRWWSYNIYIWRWTHNLKSSGWHSNLLSNWYACKLKWFWSFSSLLNWILKTKSWSISRREITALIKNRPLSVVWSSVWRSCNLWFIYILRMWVLHGDWSLCVP